MDRVAASAGVSKRTVYNHFTSKQALFDAIAARLIERVQRGGNACYEPDRPIDEQLRSIAGELLDMLTAESFLTLARVTMAELIRSPELARDTYALFRRQQTGLARWLAAAARDDQLAIDDPTWAADAFYGLLKSYALWPQLLGGQPPPDRAQRARIIDTTVTMFLAGHSPPPGAPAAS